MSVAIDTTKPSPTERHIAVSSSGRLYLSFFGLRHGTAYAVDNASETRPSYAPAPEYRTSHLRPFSLARPTGITALLATYKTGSSADVR